MSQATGKIRKDFLCPQCHQDMSNMEMLQEHLRTVHTKPSSPTEKGLFSLVKQKIKGTPTDSKPPSEPPKRYAQYFSSNCNYTYSKTGYMRSYDDYFRSVRQSKVNQIVLMTRQNLLRLELLTNTNERIPRSGNTKERQKYEQNIVPWMEDAVTSICASCLKSFGLFGRKHHCRLDGRIICNSCSQFISFSIAQWIIEFNASSCPTMNEVIRLRLNNLIKIISPIILNDGSNEEYLRICLPCGRFLQRYYDKIRFIHTEKDQLFQYYEKIVELNSVCQLNQPIYSMMIDSLVKGETNHQSSDAQHLYQQLLLNYDKIDSISVLIAKLADSGHENDRRYTAVCRNIRSYSIQLTQTYSRSTKCVPGKEDIKRISEERTAKSTSSPPPETKRPIIRQDSHVIQFVKDADAAFVII